jgi:hypothetical protein
MIKMKALLVVGLTACALATTVSSAFAKFHAAEYPVKVHAQNVGAHVFETTKTGARLECQTVHFYGEQQIFADTEQIKMTAEYLKCEAVKPFKATLTVNMDGCQYNFHQNGTVTIECPKGQEIKVTTSIGCSFTVGPQGPLSTITYTNQSTTPKTILVKAAVTGGTVTTSSGCLGNINAGEGFTYSGEAKTEAQKDTGTFEQVGIEVV